MNIKLERPIVFFDLETTGIQIATDRIVEISVLKDTSDAFEAPLIIAEQFGSWVKCPELIVQVTMYWLAPLLTQSPEIQSVFSLDTIPVVAETLALNSFSQEKSTLGTASSAEMTGFLEAAK